LNRWSFCAVIYRFDRRRFPVIPTLPADSPDSILPRKGLSGRSGAKEIVKIAWHLHPSKSKIAFPSSSAADRLSATSKISTFLIHFSNRHIVMKPFS
jgi:hypothetical protein